MQVSVPRPCRLSLSAAAPRQVVALMPPNSWCQRLASLLQFSPSIAACANALTAFAEHDSRTLGGPAVSFRLFARGALTQRRCAKSRRPARTAPPCPIGLARSRRASVDRRRPALSVTRVVRLALRSCVRDCVPCTRLSLQTPTPTLLHLRTARQARASTCCSYQGDMFSTSNF